MAATFLRNELIPTEFPFSEPLNNGRFIADASL